MIQQVLSNISTAFKFYRRNRLVLVVVLISLLVTALTMLPGMMLRSNVQHMQMIKMFAQSMHGFIFVLTSALGMLFLWHHTRNRSLKMVFTKPCPPEVWVFSGLLSAIIAAIALYAVTLLACILMFLLWGVSVQWGLLYITLNNLCKTVIALSYLWGLTSLFNPITALAIMLVLQEETFYYFKLMLGASVKSAEGPAAALLFKTLQLLNDTVYLIVPSYSPFEEGTSQVYETLRLSDGPAFNLIMSVSYSATLLMLFGIISVYSLKRKRLT